MHSTQEAMLKSKKFQSGRGVSLGPPYCGFATAPFAGPSGWEAKKQSDCRVAQFQRFSELWESKWTGDVAGVDVVENRSLERVSSKFSSACEAKKQRAEKFRLAEGFEDWGIPRYPEDYVDPAEISIDSRSLD